MKQTIENKIINQLKELDNLKLLTLGYLLSKRLFANYSIFCESHDFGKPEIIYEALTLLRKQILGIDNSNKIKHLAEFIWNDEDTTPNTDDFAGSLIASLALNSVSATYHCLKFNENKEFSEIEKITKVTLDSSIMYFVVSKEINQNEPKEEYYKTIYNSKFVKSEIELIQSVIAQLSKAQKIDSHFLLNLKIEPSNLGEKALDLEAVFV